MPCDARRIRSRLLHGHRPSGKGAAKQVCVLSEDGQIERLILQSMDGRVSNQEVARKLMTEFPDLFAGFNDALGRVGSVARRLGVD